MILLPGLKFRQVLFIFFILKSIVMKPNILSFSLIFFLTSIFSATAQIKNKLKPEAPCCIILSIGPVDGLTSADPVGPVDAITLVRDNITGRTFLFYADAADKNNLHVGDAINADMSTNKIIAIKDVAKTYAISQPNPLQPCCAISSIQLANGSGIEVDNGGQGNIINARNNTTGQNFSFTINESYLGATQKNMSVVKRLKVGQPVSLAMQNSYAFFKTNINGSLATYSYPVENNVALNSKSSSKMPRDTIDGGNMGTNGDVVRVTNGNGSWEIKPDPTIKGIGGEITMEIPKGLRYNTNLEFFNAGEKTNRQASWFGNNKAKLLPGMYDVVIDSRDTIKNVPVELGKQTRLKMGVFMVSGYSDANLENSTTHQKFHYGAPFKILLPEGTYYINGKKKYPVVIKDGEMTKL